MERLSVRRKCPVLLFCSFLLNYILCAFVLELLLPLLSVKLFNWSNLVLNFSNSSDVCYCSDSLLWYEFNLFEKLLYGTVYVCD